MTETEEWLRERIRYSDEYEIVEVLVKDLASIANEIERMREDNDKLQRMLKMAATWTADPGVTIAEIREVFSLLDRSALEEKE